jgi:hypothetical protein
MYFLKHSIVEPSVINFIISLLLLVTRPVTVDSFRYNNRGSASAEKPPPALLLMIVAPVLLLLLLLLLTQGVRFNEQSASYVLEAVI